MREDIISVLSIVTGQQKAAQLVTNAENYVKAQARTGALQAVPTIKMEVKTTVKPYVYIALGLGAIGALLGGLALARGLR